MNAHVIEYVTFIGSRWSNWFVIGEISHATYMKKVSIYNEVLKREISFSLEREYPLGECANFEPLRTLSKK